MIKVDTPHTAFTSWQQDVTATTRATRSAIWEMWTDVEGWANWKDHINEAHLSSPFAAGATGEMQTTFSKKATPFSILNAETEKSYTDRSHLPLGVKVDVIHTMKDTPMGLHLTHRVRVSGLFSFLMFGIGRKLVAGLPAAMERMLAAAEARP